MNKTIIHIINILIGVVSVGLSLFFTWGVLAFGPEGNMLIIALPLVVILIWIIVYILQMKLYSIKVFIVLLLIEFMLLLTIFSLIELN